jgi:Ca2+/Na+ antiporter
MLGSMLTNMLFVFGVACMIGGTQWQVQELRITSGNVSVVMLLVATAGALFPAALVLAGQLPSESEDINVPSVEEITFCRVNSFVMFFLYICYLIFQLGTHKEEFDEEMPVIARRTRRNLFCLRHIERAHTAVTGEHVDYVGHDIAPLLKSGLSNHHIHPSDHSIASSDEGDSNDLPVTDNDSDGWASNNEDGAMGRQRRRRMLQNGGGGKLKVKVNRIPRPSRIRAKKSKNSDADKPEEDDNDSHEHAHAIHFSGAFERADATDFDACMLDLFSHSFFLASQKDR